MEDKYIVCALCKKDAAGRMEWNESCGSVQDWLETLIACNTIADCINWWECVNSIRWNIPSTKELAKAYVDYLSNVVSLERWGKALSKRFTLPQLVA